MVNGQFLMKHSWSFGRAVVSKTLIFRKVRCKIWSWKHWRNRMFGRFQSPETRTSLCWQTVFNYRWTSVAHKEQSVIELKVYACHDWEGFPILAKGRSQGRVPGVLERPFWVMKMVIISRGKKYRNATFEIPRDDIFVFEEEQTKSNLKRHHMLYRMLYGSIHGVSFFLIF